MSTEARAKMRLGPQLNVPDIPPSPLPDTLCVAVYRVPVLNHLNVRPCVPFASRLPRGLTPVTKVQFVLPKYTFADRNFTF